MLRIDDRTVEFTALETEVKEGLDEWREYHANAHDGMKQTRYMFVAYFGCLPRSIRVRLTPDFVSHITDQVMTWDVARHVAVPVPVNA
jgi:hypothetical protein